jgi:hypothetical protein
MDLEQILTKGWADPQDLTAAEFAEATDFWQGMRTHDKHLSAVRRRASDLIQTWTRRTPRDVGSFGTQVNLDSSDLDLGIGCPVEDRPALVAALDGRAQFKGERRTSFSTTRLVYSFTVDGIEIDLSALTDDDFVTACRMLDQIDHGMTTDERIAHTWIKQHLRATGRLDDYARWKLVVYAKYCPEFNWVPIPECPVPSQLVGRRFQGADDGVVEGADVGGVERPCCGVRRGLWSAR